MGRERAAVQEGDECRDARCGAGARDSCCTGACHGRLLCCIRSQCIGSVGMCGHVQQQDSRQHGVREGLMDNAALWGTLGRSSPCARHHDGSEEQAPPWRAEAFHIWSGRTAATVRASEQTTARSSLLPVLSDCALTWRVRALLPCVEPLQRGGVAEQRQRSSAQSCSAGRPQCSRQQKLKPIAMGNSSVLNGMVRCRCVSDL
jgi:hypothetical protein